MKRTVFLSLLLTLALTSCGGVSVFPPSRELENLELVHTVGIDVTEDGYVLLTAATVPGLSGGEPRFYSLTSDTIVGAAAKMQKLPVGKEALFSHTEHIILSADAARERLAECLDFVERSNDFRIDTNLFVAKSGEAQALMRAVSGEESDISALLKFMADNADQLGEGHVFTCREIASDLSQRGAALLQAVEASEAADPEAEEKVLLPAGLCAVRDGELMGFLSEDESRGAAMILNKVEAREDSVTVDGVTVALTVNGAKTRLRPVFSRSGDLAGVTLDVSVRALIASTDGVLDTRGEAMRGKIEDALAEKIRQRVAAAMAASQEIKADFMDIYAALSLKKPLKMAKIERDWETVFPQLAISVNVKCDLARTYDLETGVNTEGEETVTIWKTRIK